MVWRRRARLARPRTTPRCAGPRKRATCPSMSRASRPPPRLPSPPCWNVATTGSRCLAMLPTTSPSSRRGRWLAWPYRAGRSATISRSREARRHASGRRSLRRRASSPRWKAGAWNSWTARPRSRAPPPAPRTIGTHLQRPVPPVSAASTRRGSPYPGRPTTRRGPPMTATPSRWKALHPTRPCANASWQPQGPRCPRLRSPTGCLWRPARRRTSRPASSAPSPRCPIWPKVASR